jgi:hypothetical protein
VHDDQHPLARAYHRLLVWDIMRRPRLTRLADRALNPVIGKSLVIYATKPGGPGAGAGARATAAAAGQAEHGDWAKEVYAGA